MHAHACSPPPHTQHPPSTHTHMADGNCKSTRMKINEGTRTVTTGTRRLFQPLIVQGPCAKRRNTLPQEEPPFLGFAIVRIEAYLPLYITVCKSEKCTGNSYPHGRRFLSHFQVLCMRWLISVGHIGSLYICL